MSFKSRELLIDFVNQQSQQRKRELIGISQSLKLRREKEESLLCRTAILLAYAHWEGFVKDISLAYVSYVAFKAPAFETLTQNFQALAFRAKIAVCGKATKRIQPHLDLLQEILDSQKERVSIDPQKSIDTESNLDSKVFENICRTVGIDYESYWSTYSHYIDDLVKTRCRIAHGELTTPSKKYAIEVLSFTQKSIDQFGTDISNATVMETFVRK